VLTNVAYVHELIKAVHQGKRRSELDRRIAVGESDKKCTRVAKEVNREMHSVGAVGRFLVCVAIVGRKKLALL
jgi:bacterioferritin-associated ferredoxin